MLDYGLVDLGKIDEGVAGMSSNSSKLLELWKAHGLPGQMAEGTDVGIYNLKLSYPATITYTAGGQTCQTEETTVDIDLYVGPN